MSTAGLDDGGFVDRFSRPWTGSNQHHSVVVLAVVLITSHRHTIYGSVAVNDRK